MHYCCNVVDDLYAAFYGYGEYLKKKQALQYIIQRTTFIVVRDNITAMNSFLLLYRRRLRKDWWQCSITMYICYDQYMIMAARRHAIHLHDTQIYGHVWSLYDSVLCKQPPFSA